MTSYDLRNKCCHFQNENNDFYNKTFKDEGWNLYAFSTSRLEKGTFSWGKSWKKVFFYQKEAGILYLSLLEETV